MLRVAIGREKVEEYKDSLEIGTPGKGGCIKIYGDSSKPKEFKQKVEEMFLIRKFANAKEEL